MEVAALTPACSKRRFVEADVADRTFFSQLGVSGGLSGFFPHPALKRVGGEFGAGLKNPVLQQLSPQKQKVGNQHSRELQESFLNEVQTIIH